MDIETRRKKQKALIVKLVERKVRSRAKQLYETRGEVDGHALQDWVQAESEVVGKGILAPLYRKSRAEHPHDSALETGSEFSAPDSSACESPA